ncbi:MAG: DNA cytosine methyltransferase [Prevotellaceae bacterium]|jgi:DNA (cytosine-5)-methyltransferase 1|nr:DNA cytosine methyltransferase [Prevotellaceae bacterium]
MKKLTHGSLFSGIGGFDLAAQWSGFRNVFWCENDKHCREWLKSNFPKTTKHYGDITTQNFETHRGKIDILSGGFPCQDISVAGQNRGIASDTQRGLFLTLSLKF